jgi:hypothetical protein
MFYQAKAMDDFYDYESEYFPKNNKVVPMSDYRIKLENAKDDSNFGFEKMTFSKAGDLIIDLKPLDWLVDDVLQSGTIGIMAGKPSSFKSFFALELANGIATGTSFLGHAVESPRLVVIVCGEGKHGLSRRLKALSIVHGNADFGDNIVVLDNKISIDKQDDIRELALSILEMKPGLVVFDTFSSLNSQTNENDNSEVANVLHNICRSLMDGENSDTAVLIVHHFGKDSDKGVRGASAFVGNTDFIMLTEREEDKGMKARLSCFKMKDAEEFAEIQVEARVVELGIWEKSGYMATSLVLALDGSGADFSSKHVKQKPKSQLDFILEASIAKHGKEVPYGDEMVLGVAEYQFRQDARKELTTQSSNPETVRKLIYRYILTKTIIEGCII